MDLNDPCTDSCPCCPHTFPKPCPHTSTDEVLKRLCALVSDDDGCLLIDRQLTLINHLLGISEGRIKMREVKYLTIILEFLCEFLDDTPQYKTALWCLLRLCQKPPLLMSTSEAVGTEDILADYLTGLGNCLIIVNDPDIKNLIIEVLHNFLGKRDQNDVPYDACVRALVRSKIGDKLSKLVYVANDEFYPQILDLTLKYAIMSKECAMVLLESDTIFWLLSRIELQPNPYSTVPSYISELTSSIIWRLLSYLGKRRLTSPMHFQEEIMKFLRNWLRKEVLYGKPQVRNDIATIICRILYIFPADNVLKSGIFEDISLLAFATEFEIKHSWAKSVKFLPTRENLNFKKLLILIICAMFKHPGIRMVAENYNVLPGLALLLGTGSGKSETSLWPEDYKCILTSYVLHALPVLAQYLPNQYLASGATQKILELLQFVTENPSCQSQEMTKCTLHCLNSLIIKGICPEHFIQWNTIQIVLDVAGRLLHKPLTLMNQLLLSHCFILLSTLSADSLPRSEIHHLIASVGLAIGRRILNPEDSDSKLDGSLQVTAVNFIWHAIVRVYRIRKIFADEGGVYLLLDLAKVLAGVVSKTRLGISKTLIILSALLCSMSVGVMTSRILVGVQNGPTFLSVPAMLFICMLLGGVNHCLRLTALNEFDLPQDYPRFLHIKFFITELEYIGKTVGGFLVTGGYKPAPNAVLTSSVWVIFSSIVFLVALIGPRVFQKEKDARNIIGDFLKHTFYYFKANLLNKQNEEKFSADDMERIKIVHSATVLYVPVIILIGLKDLKYSRYTWQSLDLTLTINGLDMSPQKILIGYPLTVMLSLPIAYYLIYPYFKKKVESHKTRITTRAIVAFYFMAASLAFATILQCRIEMDQSRQSQNGTVSIFNFLPCNATVRVFCGMANTHKVNSLEMIRIPCPKLRGEFDPKVVQGKCVIDGMKRFFSMSVVLIHSLDMMVAVGYDFHLGPKSSNGSYPIYIQHLHYPHEQQGTGGKLILVHNVMVNHTFALVPAKLSKHDFWVPAGESVYTKLLSSFDNSHIKVINAYPGWYGILLDNQLTKILHYEQSKTYAILVAHEKHYNVKVKTLLVSAKRTRSVLYQIPQVLMSGLAEMVIENPGFIYGRKKIPIEWRDFAQTIWTFSCFLGNTVIVIGTALLRGERNLLAFITGTAASVVSIALITIFLLDYFRADYEERRDDKSQMPVQVLILAVLADMSEDSAAIPQLVTWRGESETETVIALLCQIWRKQEALKGVKRDGNGCFCGKSWGITVFIINNYEYFKMGEVWKNLWFGLLRVKITLLPQIETALFILSKTFMYTAGNIATKQQSITANEINKELHKEKELYDNLRSVMRTEALNSFMVIRNDLYSNNSEMNHQAKTKTEIGFLEQRDKLDFDLMVPEYHQTRLVGVSFAKARPSEAFRIRKNSKLLSSKEYLSPQTGKVTKSVTSATSVPLHRTETED